MISRRAARRMPSQAECSRRLSYAPAQPSLVASIQRLTSRFPGLQPVLSTHLRQQLVEQVRTGELDVALGFLSADDTMPGDLASSVLATERLVLVKAKGPQSPAAAPEQVDRSCARRTLGAQPARVLHSGRTRGEAARAWLAVQSCLHDQQHRHEAVSRGERDRLRAHPRHDFSPRTRGGGGWSASRGRASASRRGSCWCRPPIWAGSTRPPRFSNKSFETISLSARAADCDELSSPAAADHRRRSAPVRGAAP